MRRVYSAYIPANRILFNPDFYRQINSDELIQAGDCFIFGEGYTTIDPGSVWINKSADEVGRELKSARFDSRTFRKIGA